MSDERLPVIEADSEHILAHASRDPISWGKTSWSIYGEGASEPLAKVDDPFHEFFAIIRLERLGSSSEVPNNRPDEAWYLDGDSNFNLTGTIGVVRLSAAVGNLNIPAEAIFIQNAAGRLAAIRVHIIQAKRITDAYRAARAVFDILRAQMCFEQELAIREQAIVVWRGDGKKRIDRLPVPYPFLDFDSSHNTPGTIMQRLLTPYGSALQSQTPYYSFLVYFSLLEFLNQSWIGAVRAAYTTRGGQLPKRSYVFDDERMKIIAPWMYGKTFQDALIAYRHLRNFAGGGHFNFSIGPRAGTVTTDDELALASDVFKVATRTMLIYAREDVANLVALGATDEAALAAELQKTIDRHDGHNKGKHKGKRRK
jgi:hypothetical protein